MLLYYNTEDTMTSLKYNGIFMTRQLSFTFVTHMYIVWLQAEPDPSSKTDCPVLPGCDEVMGQVDADGGACDGDMTVTSTVQLATNLDLCP